MAMILRYFKYKNQNRHTKVLLPMQKFSTLFNFLDQEYRNSEPSSNTLQTIMAFASTYNVERMDNGELVCYFSN